MTLEQFLSYGLIPGCKYRVRLKTGGGKHKDFVLFFKGFRLFADCKTVEEPYDVVPVFCEPTANGKMSRKHFVRYSTQVHDIVLIFSTEESRYKTLNEYIASSAASSYYNYDARSSQELRMILGEMNRLFPGRVIPVSPNEFIMVKYGNNLDFSSVLIGLCTDKKGFACAVISDQFGKLTRIRLVDCNTGSAVDLLIALLRSIENPYRPYSWEPGYEPFVKYTVNEKGNSVCEYTHDTLPSPDGKKTPLLYELESLEVLKANLWFAALPYPRQETVLKDYFGVSASTPASHTYDNWLHANREQRLMCYHYYKDFPDAWKSHKH